MMFYAVTPFNATPATVDTLSSTISVNPTQSVSLILTTRLVELLSLLLTAPAFPTFSYWVYLFAINAQ